jgi:hypothetical protein
MAFSTFSTLSRFNGSAAKTTPYNLSVVTTNPYDITVSFNAPTTFTPAYYYAITGGGKKSYGTSSPITVGGLAASTGYTIRIVAVNAVGTLFTSTSSVTVTTPAVTSGTSTTPYDASGTAIYLSFNNNILDYSSGSGVAWAPSATGVIFGNTTTYATIPQKYNNYLYNGSGGGFVELNNTITVPTGATSICFWAYVGSGGGNSSRTYRPFFYFCNSGNGTPCYTIYAYIVDNTYFQFAPQLWYGSLNGGQNAGNCNLNQWNHCVWTIDSNGFWNIYVNGTTGSYGSNPPPYQITTISAQITTTSKNLFFYENSDSNNKILYNSAIDDFRIYNTVLTPTQISQIYGSLSLGAPTIGSATSITTTSAVVSFTAPSGVATGTT